MIERTTRTIVQDGIELLDPRTSKTVFIAQETLTELAEQERWDSQFGPSLGFPPAVGRALVHAGLAVKETRGGYHRTDKLLGLLEEWGW